MERPGYRCAAVAMLRAPARASVLSPWPGDTCSPETQVDWIAQVWNDADFVSAVRLASPQLGEAVDSILCAGEAVPVRKLSKVGLSLARYARRAQSRSTPFGLFAGVAAVDLDTVLTSRGVRVVWGGDNRVVLKADAAWLAAVIDRLESVPSLLSRLRLQANNLTHVRGQRLVLMASAPSTGGSRVETSVRLSSPVEVALNASKTPRSAEDLTHHLSREFPNASLTAINRLVTGLVRHHVLISSLRPPATVDDGLAYVLEQLEDTSSDLPEVAELATRLQLAHTELVAAEPPASADAVGAARKFMDTIVPVEHPVMVDTYLDATVALPARVATEVERAAGLITQIGMDPGPLPAWRDFRDRFIDRYGTGTMIKLVDALNPDTGVGPPHGYRTSIAPPPAAVLPTLRDKTLQNIAHNAALARQLEVTLTDTMITALSAERDAWPHDFDICVRVEADPAFDDFRLVTTAVSPAAGTMTGRWIHRLDPQHAADYRDWFTSLTPTSGGTAAQLSSPTLHPRAGNITASAQLIPTVLSLGEHRPSTDNAIGVHDVGVAVCPATGRIGLYQLATGRYLQIRGFDALDHRRQSPDIARFVNEIDKAQVPIGPFNWGLATDLPFLPRLRHGRTVVCPARWRIDHHSLPRSGTSFLEWAAALDKYRRRHLIPSRVELRDGDRGLVLDLAEPGDATILRRELGNNSHVVLTEAPAPHSNDWLGRAHEIVFTVSINTPPRTVSAPILCTKQSRPQPPGAPGWLFAKIYTSHHDDVIARLTDLDSHFEAPLRWWFVRYTDPLPHLRLRIAVGSPDDFGHTAHQVTAWFQQLKQNNLAGRIAYDTYYPEAGRYGPRTLDAAEDVFVADSRTVHTQLATEAEDREDPLILATRSYLDIASGLLAGSGVDWLARQRPPRPAVWPTAELRRQAAALASDITLDESHHGLPSDGHQVEVWRARRTALAEYHCQLEAEPFTPDLDRVLGSLLHMHHNRAIGIDRDSERTVLLLARTAALAIRGRRP